MPLPSHLLEKHVPQGLNLLHCLGDYKASDLHSLLSLPSSLFCSFSSFSRHSWTPPPRALMHQFEGLLLLNQIPFSDGGAVDLLHNLLDPH